MCTHTAVLKEAIQNMPDNRKATRVSSSADFVSRYRQLRVGAAPVKQMVPEMPDMGPLAQVVQAGSLSLDEEGRTDSNDFLLFYSIMTRSMLFQPIRACPLPGILHYCPEILGFRTKRHAISHMRISGVS